MDASGYLYPVPVDPVYGVNGGTIVGNPTPGKPLTAAEAAALIQHDVG